MLFESASTCSCGVALRERKEDHVQRSPTSRRRYLSTTILEHTGNRLMGVSGAFLESLTQKNLINTHIISRYSYESTFCNTERMSIRIAHTLVIVLIMHKFIKYVCVQIYFCKEQYDIIYFTRVSNSVSRRSLPTSPLFFAAVRSYCSPARGGNASAGFPSSPFPARTVRPCHWLGTKP